MKIKHDFVTNSSSSSFVIMGAYIDIQELLKAKFDQVKKILKDYGIDIVSPEAADEYRIDIIDSLVSSTGLEYSLGADSNYAEDVAVGLCYTKMNDDETLGQFKERIQNEIKKHFGVDTAVGHIEECWMDN